MKFLPLLFLVIVCAGGAIAQAPALKQQRLDSLSAQLKKDSLYTFRFKKLRPYANIDNRNSFISKRPANITGFQLGVVVNEFHIFGLGIYNLNSKSRNEAPIQDNYRISSLRYYTAFYGYVLLSRRFIGINLPFELGAGHYTAKHLDSLGVDEPKPLRYGFVPLGAAVKVILKPVRWIGLSMIGGYRYVIEGRPSLLNLDGSYYSFGVWVDLRQIYRDIKYYGFQKRRYKAAVKEIKDLS